MRLGRMDLTRYGRFTDTTLTLPRTDVDFHIVYGPNEAGKSTIRNAIAELLYGIGMRTPYAFKHHYSELLLAARLERKDEYLEIVRRKSQRDSLTDPNGTAIPPSVLHGYLGETDRSFFERMFALDHSHMVQGGQEILDSSGDLGQMLFQAAAGLGAFHAARDALSTEAGRLWSPRSKKDVQFHDANKRYEEAGKLVRKLQVGASRWQGLKRAADQAERRMLDSYDALKAAETDLHRLRRVARVAPRFQALAAIDEALLELQGGIRMPPEAASELDMHRRSMLEAKTTIRQQSDTLHRLVEQRRQTNVDTAILTSDADVEALYKQAGGIEDTLKDLPKRYLEREQLKAAITAAGADQGFNEFDTHKIESRLPTAPQRIALEDLVSEHGPLAFGLEQQNSQLATARLRKSKVSNSLASLPAAPQLGSLPALIDAADALVGATNRTQLHQGIESLLEQQRDELRALHPWAGTAEQLEKVRIPDLSELQPLLEAHASLAGQQPAFDRIRADLEDELISAEERLAAGRRQHTVPTADELSDARATRDAVLRRALTGDVRLADVADEYAHQVLSADALADRRYQAAEDATRLDLLADQRDTVKARLAKRNTQIEEVRIELSDLIASWSLRATAIGLADVDLQRMTTWPSQWMQATKTTRSLDNHRAQLARVDQQIDPLRQELLASLSDATTQLGDSATLLELVGLARKLVQDAERQTTERRGAMKELAAIEEEISLAEAGVKLAQSALDAWEARWGAALVEAGLSPTLRPSGLLKMLEIFEDLRRKIGELSSLTNGRIVPMEAKVHEFSEKVSALVARCAVDQMEQEPIPAINALQARLTLARSAATTLRSLDEGLVLAEQLIRVAKAESLAAIEALGPLLHLAGVDHPDALDPIIGASRRREDREADRDRELRTLIETGDGLDLDALRREVDSVELAALMAEIATIDRQLEALGTNARNAASQHALEKASLEAVGGTEAAALAEAQRRSALDEMAEAADSYIRAQTAARLLDWALQRFREEKQGPMLARASTYFCALTNGEHTKLIADQAGESTQLASRRSDNSIVPIDGMSDGTRDQLYLALRLAGLGLHLDSGAVALPFIADDLLINCDDTRTISSFDALSQLARKTQVIYFTHHKHLVDLALEATQGKVNVVAFT